MEAQVSQDRSTEIPPGLCQCGCRARTNPYPCTRRNRGHARGVPARFIRSHYINTPERSAAIAFALIGHQVADSTREKIAQRARERRLERFVSDGYVHVYRPEHPDANCHGHVLEHRLVMEAVIGRRIRRDEHVHHVNEIRDDNRPENLQVMTNSEHMAYHRRKK